MRYGKEAHEQTRRAEVATPIPDWSNSFVTSDDKPDVRKGVDQQGSVSGTRSRP